MSRNPVADAMERIGEEWSHLHWLTLSRKPVPLSSSVAFLRIGQVIADELAAAIGESKASNQSVGKTPQFSPQGNDE